MSKRPHSEDQPTSSSSTAPSGGGGGGPQSKKLLSTFEPVKFSNVRSLEEMERRVLQLQNKKMSENLTEKRKEILELRDRIDQLEQRQTKDDELLCIVNRYWNQMDEDCMIMLHRFDADIDEDVSPSAESFIKQLSTWDKEEVDEKLRERVHFSKRIISRILAAFDKTQRQLERLRKSLLTPSKSSTGPDGDGIKEDASGDASGEKENQEDSGNGLPLPSSSARRSEDYVHQEMADLMTDNTRLHEMAGSLQKKHHQLNLKVQELADQLQQSSDKAAEWQAKYDDMEYKFSDSQSKLTKLDRRCADLQTAKKALEEELSTLKGSDSPGDEEGGGGAVAKSKFNELTADLEESKELAANRLLELEKLQKTFEEKVEECERLKSDLRDMPDSVIEMSIPFKSLKVKFNLLYVEAITIRNQLEEARNTILANRNSQMRQVEEMENNEAMIQKQMRTEMSAMADQYNQLKKEYETMDLDWKQTQAHNEQTGPINSEMRSLIATLQVHNKQLKAEAQRYRKKFKEMQADVNKAKADLNTVEADNTRLREAAKSLLPPSLPCPSADSKASPSEDKLSPRDTKDSTDTPGTSGDKVKTEVKEEGEVSEKGDTEKGRSPSDKEAQEMIKDLKIQLKKSQDSQKDMSILLDMYKSIPKDQRDKVNLLKSEQNLSEMVESLKSQVSKLREEKEGGEMDSEVARKIKRAEESMAQSQSKLAAAKQEEDALLKEMEVTGQAFEDVQEQNTRLIQALKEKDEANFKLMSERLKTAQMSKLIKDEKNLLEEQHKMMQAQIEALNRALQKQEEKERLLLNNMNTLEKENVASMKAMEMYKRKAIESQQAVEDMRLNLQKYLSQLKEAQTAVQEKAAALERESFRHQRIQEEIVTFRRKYERLKKIEQSHNADEVLLAEIQDYKEQLTCPTCKTNRKDAILTKCFHVFCLNCLKTRYETRNRKCPKCNATFGANDYHRIYLET